jgi:hypothetical protein
MGAMKYPGMRPMMPSCRPISNGHIVTEVCMTREGCQITETFCETPPRAAQDTGVGPEGLRGAMRELNRSK